MDYFLILSHSKYRGPQLCQWMNTLDVHGMTLKAEMIQDVNLRDIKDQMKTHNVYLLEDILPNIDMPPKFLYARGRGKVTSMRVAVVGARQCSDYGRRIAFQIGKKLAEANITVVSGLAYGVDAAAHRGAIAAGGPTIGVLGSGILNCYPACNKSLYDDILSCGLIISEYGLDGQPLKAHFPFRNRIISGLAQAVIVVEARERSGTMITVRHGLMQGKDIYVVPGCVDNPLSKGTNKLIKEGAEIIVDLDEFVCEMKKSL